MAYQSIEEEVDSTTSVEFRKRSTLISSVVNTKSNIRTILYNTTRQHWPRSQSVFGTTPIEFCTNYKPGGTMMVSVGDLTGRITAQSQDKWGRWTSQTFRGTGNTNLTVISAYQVVTDNPHTGLTTATSQQQSLLLQSNESISPRKAFKRDVQMLIYKLYFIR